MTCILYGEVMSKREKNLREEGESYCRRGKNPSSKVKRRKRKEKPGLEKGFTVMIKSPLQVKNFGGEKKVR